MCCTEYIRRFNQSPPLGSWSQNYIGWPVADDSWTLRRNRHLLKNMYISTKPSRLNDPPPVMSSTVNSSWLTPISIGRINVNCPSSKSGLLQPSFPFCSPRALIFGWVTEEGIYLSLKPKPKNQHRKWAKKPQFDRFDVPYILRSTDQGGGFATKCFIHGRDLVEPSAPPSPPFARRVQNVVNLSLLTPHDIIWLVKIQDKTTHPIHW